MVQKYECAFLRGGDKCLFRRCRCEKGKYDFCEDAVRSAYNGLKDIKRTTNELVGKYDRRTKAGRFRCNTAHAEAGEVYSQCKRKHRYRDENEARLQAKICQRRYKDGTTLRVYFCHFCCGWHITKSDKGQKRKV